MTDPLLGKEVDHGEYRIVERIGSGGMGSVYKAEQPKMNRLVAIKVLHSKYANRDDLVSRFRREARAMSQLAHPNTARVYKFGQLEDGASYFVMDYMDGKNLAHVVREQGPMDLPRAVNIMVQVCGALEEAHRAGIIHRDLKPENIFLTNQAGSTDFPKVLDFGLAKVSEKQMGRGSMMLTQQGMVFGTPEFMSPEQAQGEKLDARSDVYALALILYELVTGKLPFDAKKPLDIMKAHVQEKPIPPSERVTGLTFPREFDEAIAKALEKKPANRFDSAVDFAQALRGCLTGDLKTGARRALPSDPAPRTTNTASQRSTPRADPSASTSRADDDPPVLPISRTPLILLGAVIGLGVALIAYFALSFFGK